MTFVKPYFLCIFLFSYVVKMQGLDFSLNKTPGSGFCGHLQCLVNVNQGDSTIFSIVGMTIYDVTQASSKEKIASVTVSVSAPEIYVDPARTDFLNASGSVSRYHAELALSLKRDSDCEDASFLCELDFMNLSGQLDTQQKTLAPHADECPGNLSQTASDLVSRTQQLEDELSKLNGKYKDLETKLNSILGGQVGTLPTDVAVTAGSPEATTGTTQNPQTESTQEPPTETTQVPPTTQPHTNPGSRRGCASGMSLDQPREKFTLPDNIQALCDTETDGGAWVIIQRRTKGDVDFYKNWSDYKKGFGTPDTDFWLGNDVIHSLTSQGYTELRVDLEYQGKTGYAHYSTFTVGDEGSKYKLTVSGYSGTAGDNLAYHNNMAFTTFDQDNDAYVAINCADDYHGAWWYKECYESNLNGEWGTDTGNAMMWNDFVLGQGVSTSEMKIRHV